ncbi:hypothetical protein SAMN04489713_101958 [Actinomadura madurae]|uniref:Uncharacterized protein n=1 Tax=Actinomadura madurae TaxID=1993 RepID=A0A1I4XQZ6_9ACTN|nr:hypothetical protein [Actinomadura madurae]SFN27709.1 hypothetical protein SAMN04489713_101958 [Actinomadura madurae]
MRQDKLTPRAREPDAARRAEPRDAGAMAGVTAARDEAAGALHRLDAARRAALARRETGTALEGVVRPVQEERLAEAARALAEAARELTRLLRDQALTPRTAPRSAPRTAGPSRTGDDPLVTLDLAHRIAPGWRLCQFTTADRDAHRWHLRHDGHAAGAVTHVLDLRGRRTGWEARDARGFRLRPGPGPEAYRPAAPHLWATRTAAVRAVARAHRCP